MPQNIVFHYFYGRGIGEPIRLMFAIGGVAFDDRRYTIDEFKQMTDLKAKFPFGQMPTLEIDGGFIGQTDSISRYAARLAGLYPNDPLAAARCDMVVVYQAEVQSALAKMVYDGVPGAPGTKQFPAEIKAQKLSAWFADSLPAVLQRLENLAADNTVLEGGLSWADVAIFCRLNHLRDMQANWRLQGFPKLRAIYANVAEQDAVKAWVAAHPEDYEGYDPAAL